MLAFMPQSAPPPDFHMSNSMANSTMSVTLLPSAPISCSQPPLLETPTAPSPSKRPKLSLNTSGAAPIFGKGSTSLRLETLSATSPTARNTFRNRQDQQRALAAKTKLSIPALTPLLTAVPAPPPSVEIPTPSKIPLPESAVSEVAEVEDTQKSPASSITSVSTVESTSTEVPYRLPFNARSILRNGPLPRPATRRLSFSQSKPMFPAAKRVCFRTQLTEDIETSIYTLRHSDIEPMPVENQNDEVEEETQHDEERPLTINKINTVSSPLAGSKRSSSEDEEEHDTCPVTPVAGRRKKDREWVWTLGPIPNQPSEEKMSVEDDATVN